MAAQRLFCFWRSYCRVANNNRARYPASRALLSGDCRTRPLRSESATADTLAIPVIRSSGGSSELPSTSSSPIVPTRSLSHNCSACLAPAASVKSQCPTNDSDGSRCLPVGGGLRLLENPGLRRRGRKVRATS